MSRDDGKPKTKAQLRAEAVERLRDTDAWLSTSADLINAMLGDRCEVGMANKRRYFIDLLTDEEPQDGTTPEFDVPLYGWHEGDTREKLEAEILDAGCADEIDYDRIVGWLDRQAAITRIEVENEHADEILALNRHRGELQAKVDELEDENARLRSCISDDAEYSKLVMGECRDLRAKVDELTEERDTYRDNMKSLELRADRLESELKDTDGQLRNQEHNARQSAKARAVWQERYESACEENRILRDKLRSIADDDVTVFDMRLDEVRGLKAENEQLRMKLSRAYDNAHDTLRTM